MRNIYRPAVLSALATCVVMASIDARAQTPAAPAPNANVVVEKPTYVALPMEVTVNKPAAEVWKRVGKWCDISEWLQIPGGCQVLSGTAGELGAIRSVGSEVLVGRTELSYTYTQPPRAGRPYDLYHGTLEARPVSATTSKLIYTLMYDTSMLGDDAARERNKQQRMTIFMRALNNMKVLAEGGTLPPPPAPAAPAATTPPR